MSEWKKSLNTKDEAIAHKRWLGENNRFMAASATAEKLLSGIPLAPYDVVAAGKAIAVKDVFTRNRHQCFTQMQHRQRQLTSRGRLRMERIYCSNA